MKRSAWLAVFFVVLSTISCGRSSLFGGGAQGKKLAQGTIFLIPTGISPPCVIKTIPQVLEVQARKDQVLWSIVDACRGTDTSDVEIVFPDGAANDPTDACTADTGQSGRRGKQKIRCTIKSSVLEKAYKYTVRLEGNATPEDPELEIVY
jgi:hypothetical protein